MRSRAIKRAELQYWALDSPSTGRLQTYGMSWYILPASGSLMYVPALRGQGSVRCLDMGIEYRC